MPAAPGPTIAATCGTTPDITICSRKSAPVSAKTDGPYSSSDAPPPPTPPPPMRAPPESTSHTIGMRWRRHSSRMRAALASPVGPIEPPSTVKSYAATPTGRPSTLPKPHTTASAGESTPGCLPRIAELLEGLALVEEQRDALARGELAARVLLRDALGAAHLRGARAPRFQLGDALALRAHRGSTARARPGDHRLALLVAS